MLATGQCMPTALCIPMGSSSNWQLPVRVQVVFNNWSVHCRRRRFVLVLCADAHLLCQQGPLALDLCACCLHLLARVIKLAREGRQAATPLLKLATVLIQLSSGSLSQVAPTERVAANACQMHVVARVQPICPKCTRAPMPPSWPPAVAMSLVCALCCICICVVASCCATLFVPSNPFSVHLCSPYPWQLPPLLLRPWPPPRAPAAALQLLAHRTVRRGS